VSGHLSQSATRMGHCLVTFNDDVMEETIDGQLEEALLFRLVVQPTNP
jgi:hypothetical protein